MNLERVNPSKEALIKVGAVKYRPGDVVTIKTGSSTIERDWKLVKLQNGSVVVEKMVNGELVRKEVDLGLFNQYQTLN